MVSVDMDVLYLATHDIPRREARKYREFHCSGADCRVKDVLTMKSSKSAVPLSTNKHLIRWVDKMAELTRPARIHWVDGSQQEYDALCAQMIESGMSHIGFRCVLRED